MTRTDQVEAEENALAPVPAITRLAAGAADAFGRFLDVVEEHALHVDALLAPGSAVRQEVAEIRMACGQGIRFVSQLREVAGRAAGGEMAVAELDESLARLCGSRRTEGAADERMTERSEEELLLLSLGEHAGALAHRFNNLLTVVKGNTELMLGDLPLDHPARDPLTALDGAVDEAGRLTLRLSGFGCRRILQPQPVDLRELPALLPQSQPSAAPPVVEWVLPDGATEVLADRVALAALVGELVSNARALGEAIAIRVVVGVEKLGVGAESSPHPDLPPGEYAVIRVIDDGGGFAPGALGRRFQPFAISGGSGGGLGLANAYGLARQMGGALWVESTPGSGSEVRVRLPLIAELQAPTPSRARPGLLPDRELTVLVVDDSEAVRSILRKLLGRWGYRVMEAEDGRHAAEVAASHSGPIDLIITDVVMPYLSGPEAYRRIARKRPDVRVIFMSGYSDNTLSTHRLAADGQAILAKPITAVDLARRVAGLWSTDEAREQQSRA